MLGYSILQMDWQTAGHPVFDDPGNLDLRNTGQAWRSRQSEVAEGGGPTSRWTNLGNTAHTAAPEYNENAKR